MPPQTNRPASYRRSFALERGFRVFASGWALVSAVSNLPKGLGAAGAALWRAVFADVAEGWRLDARDLAQLEAASRAADRAAELEALIAEDGLMAAGSQGQPVLHPAVAEARMTRALVASLVGKIEIAPPRSTGRSARQDDQLRDARAKRWPGSGHG